MVTAQEPMPEQAPPQPEKREPFEGVAVTPTLRPAGNDGPVGMVEMVPVPLPVVEVERVYVVAKGETTSETEL